MTPEDAKAVLTILREMTDPTLFVEHYRERYANATPNENPLGQTPEEMAEHTSAVIRRALGLQAVPATHKVANGNVWFQYIASERLDLADWGELLIKRCQDRGILLTGDREIMGNNDLGNAWIRMNKLKAMAIPDRGGERSPADDA